MLRDRIQIHYENISNRLFASIRRQKLNNTDFSIISNNCWGGHVYRHFGLPYASPTVWLYFYSEDYLEFLENLKVYLDSPLEFIDISCSKHCADLKARNQGKVLIGLLNKKVEIIFLHYTSQKEALEKWERRRKRVNFDNLIVKFSQMNQCSQEDLNRFHALPYPKKLLFVPEKSSENQDYAVRIKKYSNEERVLDDTTYFARHTNLVEIINRRIKDETER